ncbi:methionyl-tRNA formyltransferase [Aggregatilineales bacterium SYSU G02658]
MARIVFMGTPEFAVPSLKALIAHHQVVGVVTQPDRPAGRGGELRPPPIKELAQAHSIPCVQPVKLREVKDWLRAQEADLFVVAAFGQILPQSVLDMPRHGCLNVHGSLLPRWRGAAPIHAAIRAGDAETGITIMLMDAGLDTGPMLTQASTPIKPDDTSASLHDRMAELGANLLIQTIPPYLNGQITPQPQDDALATYAPQLSKEEGRIDWSLPAVQIERTIRAFDPWPGTFTHWDGKLLKVHRARLRAGQQPAGSVALIDGALCVGTGDGLLELVELQLEGRKRVTADDFLRGHPQIVGAQLGG